MAGLGATCSVFGIERRGTEAAVGLFHEELDPFLDFFETLHAVAGKGDAALEGFQLGLERQIALLQLGNGFFQLFESAFE